MENTVIYKATGKTLADFRRAVADCFNGCYDRLREFGVQTEKKGDTFIFTFRGNCCCICNLPSKELMENHLQQLIVQMDIMTTKAQIRQDRIASANRQIERVKRELQRLNQLAGEGSELTPVQEEQLQILRDAVKAL